VLQESPKKPLALLVRGRDTYGHFEILPPPAPIVGEDTARKHADIIRRTRASIT
jgi:hypothetical protein